MIDKVIISR